MRRTILDLAHWTPVERQSWRVVVFDEKGRALCKSALDLNARRATTSSSETEGD